MTLDTTRLRQLAVSDSGFVFDPLTGYTFTVNATGLAILAGLKAGRPPDEVAADLAEGFEPEGGEDIQRDVDDFVLRLREHGLVR
jgi:PqqD family protein of HPr-rel-A system